MDNNLIIKYMDEKKLLHGIIAAIIFIGLAIGANMATGISVIVVIAAMILHIGQTVNFFGRNWKNKL